MMLGAGRVVLLKAQRIYGEIIVPDDNVFTQLTGPAVVKVLKAILAVPTLRHLKCQQAPSNPSHIIRHRLADCGDRGSD